MHSHSAFPNAQWATAGIHPLAWQFGNTSKLLQTQPLTFILEHSNLPSYDNTALAERVALQRETEQWVQSMDFFQWDTFYL